MKIFPLLALLSLLIIGCATQPAIINIIEGKISTNSITLSTDDIKAECKVECKELTVSSDAWCDCINQCSQDVLNDISFGNMDMRIYLEECPINPTKETN